MKSLYDVLIVGAGPAGAIAAYHLAKAGLEVLILEKEQLPRYKVCGGGVLSRARPYLSVDIQDAVEETCSAAEVHFLDRHLHFTVERQTPIIWMTMRDRLDQLLTDAALAQGAELQTQSPLKSIREHADHIEVRAAKGHCRTRFLIASDGVMSPTAKLAGWGPIQTSIPALECEVTVPESMRSRFAGIARFDFGLIPHGYAWVFPKKEHLSIGVLCMRRKRIPMQSYVHQYLELLNLAPILKMTQRGFTIPIRPRHSPLARGRILLAGDAAGLADPITAEGISQAMASGYFAAQALVQKSAESAQISALYQKSLESHLLKEIQISRFFANLLYFATPLSNWIFQRQGQRLCEIMTDVMMGEERLSGLILNPFNFLKLLDRPQTV